MNTDATPANVGCNDGLERTGSEALWLWFGLSYATWLTLPRVLMHEMPDDWQGRMAQLLFEWDEAWDTSGLPSTRVQAVDKRNKLTKFPDWVLEYRHPNAAQILRVRSNVRHERRPNGAAVWTSARWRG